MRREEGQRLVLLRAGGVSEEGERGVAMGSEDEWVGEARVARVARRWGRTIGRMRGERTQPDSRTLALAVARRGQAVGSLWREWV